jgi:hypothetical protein
MTAKRVIRRSLGEGGYASAGFAEGCGGATVVKPWGSTNRGIISVKSLIIESQKYIYPPCHGNNIYLGISLV